MKKGFVFLGDTANAQIREFIFNNAKHKELLEVRSTQYPEGASSFDINYYISSKSVYVKFINLLKVSKFKYNLNEDLYEVFTGTYSMLSVFTKGKISKNGQSYYLIEYRDYKGKELSPMPIKLSKDTTKKQ